MIRWGSSVSGPRDGAVQAAYAKLGSSIGRKPGHVEVTAGFLAGGAILLVLAGVLGALWAPRLP